MTSGRVWQLGQLAVGLIAMLLIPAVAQVFPGWIGRFYERDSFLSAPVLDLFFAADGGVWLHEAFEVNESGEVIAGGESNGLVLVLPDSSA